MDNDDNHNDDGDVHNCDYVMTDLNLSAMLMLTNKHNHSDCLGRIRNNNWERFEAARSAAEESSIYIYIYIRTNHFTSGIDTFQGRPDLGPVGGWNWLKPLQA